MDKEKEHAEKPLIGKRACGRFKVRICVTGLGLAFAVFPMLLRPVFPIPSPLSFFPMPNFPIPFSVNRTEYRPTIPLTPFKLGLFVLIRGTMPRAAAAAAPETCNDDADECATRPCDVLAFHGSTRTDP